jgi:hypothetical protein
MATIGSPVNGCPPLALVPCGLRRGGVGTVATTAFTMAIGAIEWATTAVSITATGTWALVSSAANGATELSRTTPQ